MMETWKCPNCGKTQKALAGVKEISHTCNSIDKKVSWFQKVEEDSEVRSYQR